MPQNRFERIAFAFLKVVVTVHAYAFYSLYVVNGQTLMSANGTNRVLVAIDKQCGFCMFWNFLPIWADVLVEFCFAFALEMFMRSTVSFKLICKVFNIRETNPVIFETAVMSQLFFIQPLIRTVFKLLFRKGNAEHKNADP